MAIWSGIGMNYGHQNVYDTSQTEADFTYLKAQGVTRLRIAFPNFTDTTRVPHAQDMITRALNHGFYVAWGVATNATVTATQWASYKTYIINTLLPYAISSGLSELCIGNEIELHVDGTTLTNTTVRADIRAMAATIKASSYTGKVSYTTAAQSQYMTPWSTEGLGALDLIGWNNYDVTANFAHANATIVAAFGSKGYISEFGTKGGGFSDFSGEQAFYNDTMVRIASIQQYGIQVGYSFCYRDGGFGVTANSFALALTTGGTRMALKAVLGQDLGFITRSGSSLLRGGNPFLFSGCNVVGLGLLESTGQEPALYPSTYQIDDMLLTAQEMGAGVIRAHSLGVSVGNPLSIWPTLNTTNTAAFAPIDYAIYRAGQLGLRFIIPLTDNLRNYYGGKHTFTDWRGLTTSASLITDEAVFYTNSTVIADFKAYISTIMNRLNPYNGLHYYEDPTIMAWETGSNLQTPQPGPTWTESIAAYIKGITSNQLVVDGSCGVDLTALSCTHVDCYTNHFYPPQNAIATIEANAVAAASKVYIIGEWGWTFYTGGTLSISQETTTANVESGSNSLKAVVTTASPVDFAAQVQQTGLTLNAGSNYTLTFWIKALVGYTMSASIQQNHDRFLTYATAKFTTTTSWVQQTIHLTGQSITDTGGVMVVFNLGLRATTTWIDNVSLVDDAVGTNLLSNPDFEGGSLSPWVVNNVTFDALLSFMSNTEGNTNIAGDLPWTLFPHRASSGWHMHTTDSYSIYYPGLSSDAQVRASQMRAHAYKMQGVSPAPAALITQGPNIYSVQQTDTQDIITWSGVPGGFTYSIESATSQNGTYTVLASGLTDFQGSYSTLSSAATVWYRVKATNYDGVAGSYGPSVQAFPRTSQVHADGRTGGQGDGVPR